MMQLDLLQQRSELSRSTEQEKADHVECAARQGLLLAKTLEAGNIKLA